MRGGRATTRSPFGAISVPFHDGIRIVRSGLSVSIAALLAALGLVSLLRLVGRDPGAGLAAILPIDTDPRATALALMTGITFLATAVGLVRGKRLSWLLAVITFATALVTQVAIWRHPIGASVALGVLAILLADRGRYRVDSAPVWRRASLAAIIVAGLSGIVETALVITATGDWPGPLAVLGDLTAGAASALGLDDDVAQAIFGAAGLATLIGSLVVIARLPILLMAVGVLSAAPDRPMSPSDRRRAERLLRRFGQGALLPFQLGSDKSAFVASSGDGLVVHACAGRTAVVLGDPVGTPSGGVLAMSEFVAATRAADRVVVVYQATPASRGLLHAAGFQRVFRIGQEAVLDIASFDLQGSRRANLRHTITRFRRAGATVRVWPGGLSESDVAEVGGQLAACDAAWQSRNGPQLGFTISGFDLADLRREPVAIAFDGEGRTIAFVTFRSTGTDGGLVLDLMRRLPGSVPGAVEACIAGAVDEMRAMGLSRLSLGLAPLAGLRTEEGPIEERALRAAAQAVARWYDVDGLAFFKAKFDPVWEPRYAAVLRPWHGIALAESLLRLHIGDGSVRSAVTAVLGFVGRSLLPRRDPTAGGPGVS